MPALTDVALCNLALFRCGLGTIAGFAEDSDKARTCASMYPTIRDGVIAMHPWRFANGKIELTRLVATPVNVWKYAYDLPPDMLAGPYAVYNGVGQGVNSTAQFEIFGDKLYSDDERIVIDYRFRPSESKFPALFVFLMQYVVAASIGQILTDNTKLTIQNHVIAFGTPSENMRGGLMGKAMTENAMNNAAMKLQDDSIVAARFS